MEVLLRLLAMLALLLAGTALRSREVLDARRTKRLNAVAYYGALPALVFVATYDQAIEEIVSWELFVGVAVVLLVTVALAFAVNYNRGTDGRRSVAIIQSYHSNLGYLGVPLIAATFSSEVTAVASVILGIGALLQVPLTVFLLVSMNGPAQASLAPQLQSLVRNPVLAALVAGLTIGWFQFPVHSTATLALDGLGSLALPLALLCVGASLDVDRPVTNLGTTASVVGLKLACMPAVAWMVFLLLDVNAATFTAGVVMLGMPTAVSTYVFAAELGGDAEFASLNVFATTVFAVASLAVLIELLARLGPAA